MIPAEIHDLVRRGALFVFDHSGGKDSQVMYLEMCAIVPFEQRVLVHADLGRVEWAEQRQCTSDLKRGPIEKTIRHLTYARKAAGHPAWNLVVNCMGLRAEESVKRRKLEPFTFSKRNSKAGREWYELLPVHGLTEGQVFAKIAAAGQKPHIIYSLGMGRFSCVFCIYAPAAQLRRAAELVRDRPELVNDPNVYKNYVALERSTGQVMIMPVKGVKLSLEQITGIAA